MHAHMSWLMKEKKNESHSSGSASALPTTVLRKPRGRADSPRGLDAAGMRGRVGGLGMAAREHGAARCMRRPVAFRLSACASRVRVREVRVGSRENTHTVSMKKKEWPLTDR